MVINAGNIGFREIYNSNPIVTNKRSICETSIKTQTTVNQDRVDFPPSDGVKSTEINAYDLTNYFGWKQVKESLSLDSSIYIGDVGEYLGNASSLYTNIEASISNNFTGAEKAEQLKMLNDTFSSAINAFTDKYIKIVSGMFDYMGVDIPESDIRESIQGIFTQKNNTHFTANDLTALGLVALNCTLASPFFNFGTDSNKHSDTSAVGLDLSMNYLYAMETMSKLGVSDKMRDMINNCIDTYTEHCTAFAERKEQDMMKFAEMLARIGKSSSHICNPNIRGEITTIMNLTKELYASKKDVVSILQEVCAFAYNQNKDKISDYWKNFYNNGNGKSTMGELLENWNDFSLALDKGDYKSVMFSITDLSNLFKL